MVSTQIPSQCNLISSIHNQPPRLYTKLHVHDKIDKIQKDSPRLSASNFVWVVSVLLLAVDNSVTRQPDV